METQHQTAKPSHYDGLAKHYDLLNQERSQSTNTLLESLLAQYGVKSVLDLTCGTGSQVFYLVERGYEVTGADFSASMLEIAQSKAKGNEVKLIQGDMRKLEVGKFDAVLTIFNAIGHLSKEDFQKTIDNVAKNLNPGGFYLFDIFNLDYLLHKDHITRLTIDWLEEKGGKKVRKFQYSTISESGVLASHTKLMQEGKTLEESQTLQVYSAQELAAMLKKSGFEVVQQTDIDGSPLDRFQSERILTLAKFTHL